MKSTDKARPSVRARALDAGRVHNIGVREISAVLRLPPDELRSNFIRRLKKLKANGVFNEAELASLTRIIELVTETRSDQGPQVSREIAVIHGSLREKRGVNPFAIVLAGIADDSIKSFETGRKRSRRKSGGSSRPVPFLFSVAAADVGGALLSLAWCIANGKSASFTVDEMIIGAIYMSSAAAGMLTE